MADDLNVRTPHNLLDCCAIARLSSIPRNSGRFENSMTELMESEGFRVFCKVLPFLSEPILAVWPTDKDLLSSIQGRSTEVEGALDSAFTKLASLDKRDTESQGARVLASLVSTSKLGVVEPHKLIHPDGRVVTGRRDATSNQNSPPSLAEIRDVRINSSQNKVSANLDGKHQDISIRLQEETPTLRKQLEAWSPAVADKIRILIYRPKKGRPYILLRDLIDILMDLGDPSN